MKKKKAEISATQETQPEEEKEDTPWKNNPTTTQQKWIKNKKRSGGGGGGGGSGWGAVEKEHIKAEHVTSVWASAQMIRLVGLSMVSPLGHPRFLLTMTIRFFPSMSARSIWGSWPQSVQNICLSNRKHKLNKNGQKLQWNDNDFTDEIFVP